MAAILNIFVPKESIKNDSSTMAQILLWGAIHDFYEQKQGYLREYQTTLLLQTKILKNTLCTRVNEMNRALGHLCAHIG